MYNDHNSCSMDHFSSTKAPLYKDHLSATAAVIWSLAWLLHTNFTVKTFRAVYSNLRNEEAYSVYLDL